MTTIFVYALPAQEYSKGVTVDILLLAHILMFLYQITVLLTARRIRLGIDDLCSIVKGIPFSYFYVASAAWLLWRLILILWHGPAALMFSRAVYQAIDGSVQFSTLEVAISSVTTLLVMGALAFAVINLANANQSSRPILAYLTAVIVLIMIIVTNESPIGSRRLLLVLGSLWFIVSWLSSGLSLKAYVRKRAKHLGVLLLLVGGLSVYYQHIRHNDFTDILNAKSPAELVVATLHFATSKAEYQSGAEVKHLRVGPLDFFIEVVDKSVVEEKSTEGKATWFSLMLAVPKAIFPGSKPVGDVDEVIMERFEIFPSMPFLAIDYPTSLAAIGMADFGMIGVVMAGAVLGLGISFTARMLQRARSIPMASILMLGLLVYFIGSQEGGLTAIVSSLRDAMAGFILILVFHSAAKMVRLGVRSCN